LSFEESQGSSCSDTVTMHRQEPPTGKHGGWSLCYGIGKYK